MQLLYKLLVDMPISVIPDYLLLTIILYFWWQIKRHFKEVGVHADVKYIDPTYMVRAVRANASDAILCTVLGQNAVRISLGSRIKLLMLLKKK